MRATLMAILEKLADLVIERLRKQDKTKSPSGFTIKVEIFNNDTNEKIAGVGAKIAHSDRAESVN